MVTKTSVQPALVSEGHRRSGYRRSDTLVAFPARGAALVTTATAAFTFAATAAAATAFAAALVDVTVGFFFFGSFTYALHRYGEIQVLSGKGVVAVNRDFFTLYFFDANCYGALFGARLKLHADFEIVDPLETLAGHHLFEGGVEFTVAFGRLDAHFDRFADRFAKEGVFKAGDDVAMTVQVIHWLSGLGLVNDSALIALEGVVDGDNGVGGNLHDSGALDGNN